MKILGVGFGSAASVAFVDSLRLPASGTGKVLRARILMSATRYESQGGDSLVRVDVDPADVVEYEVADLESAAPLVRSSPRGHESRRRRTRRRRPRPSCSFGLGVLEWEGGDRRRRVAHSGSSGSSGLESLSWSSVPGVFELLERGELDDERPDFERVPLPTATRAISEQLSPSEAAGRWRALLDRLRGYTRDEVLLSREPVWVPLVDLQVPPGGASTFSYARKREVGGGLELKVLGVGFGSAAAVTFGDSLTLPANEAAKSLRVRMLLTATRYVSKSKGTLVRVDAELPESGPEHQVVDLLEQPAADLSDPLLWRVIRREHLSESADSGKVTWSYSVGEQAKWDVGLGAPALAPVGGTLGLTLEANRADEVTVTFEMPYGRDYVFYAAAGEAPLVPYCAVVS